MADLRQSAPAPDLDVTAWRNTLNPVGTCSSQTSYGAFLTGPPMTDAEAMLADDPVEYPSCDQIPNIPTWCYTTPIWDGDKAESGSIPPSLEDGTTGGSEPRLAGQNVAQVAPPTARTAAIPGRGPRSTQSAGSDQAAAQLGRSAELGVVAGFLASAPAGRALVLCGEPGIGKSTVWQAGVGLARSRGFAVWCARPGEAEARLSFSVLADLLEAADPGVLARLPGPQRHALEVAVRRAEPGDQPPEPFAITAGLLGALRLAAEARPVLVAVDDLPWLDRDSARALVFAARRLAGHDVRFLVSRRDGRASELETALEPTGVARLVLGPLSFGAISALLAARLGRPLPRRVARQVFAASGGNPLFALELGRAVLERGMPQIGAGLPVPAVLGELFGARVQALPPPVRRALLAVALSAGLTGEELAAVTDPLVVEDAEASGVLTLDGARVRTSHPLLATAAASLSTAAERRDLHAALGAAVGEPVLRARHRALATPEPDARLAGEAAAAAARAAARGAAADAAELAGHALRLTAPGSSEVDGRLLTLARYLINAGEVPRATELLAGRIGTLPAGPARAAAHLLLADGAPPSVEQEYLAQAVTESAADPGLHSQALARQAIVLAVNRVQTIAQAEQLAGEALGTAASAGPDTERRALVALAWARILRGRAIDDLAAWAAGLAPVTPGLYDSSVDRPAGVRLVFRGELARAREVFAGLMAAAEQQEEPRSGTVAVMQLCEVELRAGDTAAAARALAELDQWAALEPEAAAFRARAQAMLAAVRGDPGQAAVLAAEAAALSASPGNQWNRLEVRHAAGLAALLDRQLELAIASLSAVWEHTVREGVEDPGAFPVAADLAEALAEAGQPEAANEVIGRLAVLAVAQQHPWGLATADRASATVTLAAGYDEAAAASLIRAAAAYRALGLGFDAARSLLVLGRAQRRHKKRAAARQSLERARAGFEQLGCPGWAQAASAELDRISGRRAAPGGGLTLGEQKVAELVAAGLSNKEVAAKLYLSVYTVQAHLTRAYAKLGIRSRGQLTRWPRAAV
jgi:DNA-binding CsgD family transcriptional regulator